MSIVTFKFRVKDATTGKHLTRHAIACNQVWNFCVATQREAERRHKAGLAVRWPSAFDLIKLCTGSAVDLGLHSDTVQTICRQFVASRDIHNRCPRFRASFGAKRALGWIPFIPRAVKIEGAHAVYLKRKFHFWKSRDIESRYAVISNAATALCQRVRGWSASMETRARGASIWARQRDLRRRFQMEPGRNGARPHPVPTEGHRLRRRMR